MFREVLLYSTYCIAELKVFEELSWSLKNFHNFEGSEIISIYS